MVTVAIPTVVVDVRQMFVSDVVRSPRRTGRLPWQDRSNERLRMSSRLDLYRTD